MLQLKAQIYCSMTIAFLNRILLIPERELMYAFKLKKKVNFVATPNKLELRLYNGHFDEAD